MNHFNIVTLLVGYRLVLYCLSVYFTELIKGTHCCELILDRRCYKIIKWINPFADDEPTCPHSCTLHRATTLGDVTILVHLILLHF